MSSDTGIHTQNPNDHLGDLLRSKWLAYIAANAVCFQFFNLCLATVCRNNDHRRPFYSVFARSSLANSMPFITGLLMSQNTFLPNFFELLKTLLTVLCKIDRAYIHAHIRMVRT
jgi:hypothetical protein